MECVTIDILESYGEMMEISIGDKTINSVRFSDVETAWMIKDALSILEYLNNKNSIILGGDILTEKMEYNYDSWHYNIDSNKDLSYNVECSVKLANRYISNYIKLNGNAYYVVFVVN